MLNRHMAPVLLSRETIISLEWSPAWCLIAALSQLRRLHPRYPAQPEFHRDGRRVRRGV